MKQTTVLVWKSWRDVRWLALAGLLAVFGPSAAEALAGHGWPRMAGELSAAVGPLLAILLAVTLTARDLDEPLRTFWASRPIPPGRFAAIRFLVGLATLIGVLALPTFFEAFLEWQRWLRSTGPGATVQPELRPYAAGGWEALTSFDVRVLLSQLPSQCCLYAVTFVLGALVRRAVPAALLALAAGLLVFIGPLLAPGGAILDPWRWSNVDRPLHTLSATDLKYSPQVHPGSEWIRIAGEPLFVHKEYLIFAATVALLVGLLLVAAVAVVRRDLRWRLDQRAVVWSLGMVCLLLYWGVSRDLGSTMPGHRLRSVEPVDNGAVVAARLREGKGLMAWYFDGGEVRISRVDLASSTPVTQSLFVSKLGVDPGHPHYFSRYPLVWPAGTADHALTIDARYEEFEIEASDSARRKSLELVTLDLSRPGRNAETARLDLSPWFGEDEATTVSLAGHRLIDTLPKLHVAGDTLLVSGWRCSGNSTVIEMFDIREPAKPVHMESVPVSWTSLWMQEVRPDEVAVALPWLPGLSRRQQLEAVVGLYTMHSPLRGAVEGDLLAVGHGRSDRAGEFELFRIPEEDRQVPGSPFPHSIHLKRIGTWTAPLLSRVSEKVPRYVALVDGILYSSFASMSVGVEAWDVRDPFRIRSLGTYNMPGQSAMELSLAPLPGHRLLVGATQVHVVEPRLAQGGEPASNL